ncbi:MAG: KH domain-containing protein [Bacilli bacterium]|nr:KH domain-containing protein [Bacilli bacterium]
MELVNLTEYLVKELLPNVENISVKEIESEGDKVIQVLVPSDCMSIVIGKGGNIANSIRTLVQAAAYVKKLGRVRINIDSL